MIFTQERKSASQIVPSSEKGSVLMILLDSLVTISQSHPWAGLRGCEAVVVQVLESAVILELVDGVQTVLDKQLGEKSDEEVVMMLYDVLNAAWKQVETYH